MRNLLHERGWDRTGWMQALVVATWLGAQFCGAFIYLVVVAVRAGGDAGAGTGTLTDASIMTYVVAVASAILGQVILFAIVRRWAGPPRATFSPSGPATMPAPREPSPFSAEARPTITGPAALPPGLPAPRRHSRRGIYSFALACLAGVSMVMLFVSAGYMETTSPGGLDEDSPTTMLIGFLTLGLMFLSLVAVGLGIAGLASKGRRRVFAVLGTVLSGLIVLGVSLVLVLP